MVGEKAGRYDYDTVTFKMFAVIRISDSSYNFFGNIFSEKETYYVMYSMIVHIRSFIFSQTLYNKLRFPLVIVKKGV